MLVPLLNLAQSCCPGRVYAQTQEYMKNVLTWTQEALFSLRGFAEKKAQMNPCLFT